jgi:hypothetical protein
MVRVTRKPSRRIGAGLPSEPGIPAEEGNVRDLLEFPDFRLQSQFGRALAQPLPALDGPFPEDLAHEFAGPGLSDLGYEDGYEVEIEIREMKAGLSDFFDGVFLGNSRYCVGHHRLLGASPARIEFRKSTYSRLVNLAGRSDLTLRAPAAPSFRMSKTARAAILAGNT